MMDFLKRMGALLALLCGVAAAAVVMVPAMAVGFCGQAVATGIDDGRLLASLAGRRLEKLARYGRKA